VCRYFIETPGESQLVESEQAPARPLSTHRPLGQIQSPLFVLAQNKHNKKEQQAGMGLCIPVEYMDDSPMLTYYFLAISSPPLTKSYHWHVRL
jgi:hypothetical protein